MISGLAAVAIYVTDLERAKTFYTETLGLKPAGEMPPGISLSTGDATIYLEGGRTARTAEPGATLVSPAFESEQVRAFFDELKGAGVTIVEEYQEFGPGFAMFKAADPDGNVFEVAGTP